jgi:putative nucleotidyltransferase with HDIG domain
MAKPVKAKDGAQEAAAEIVAKLRAAGREAYFVGGCVRDMLLGRAPADYDVATSARPEEVLGLFDKTFAVGAQFGVVLVVSEAGDDAEQEILTEVATFRSDGVYSDGRRPDTVRFADSAEEDVQRRDFTINGLLLDPEALVGSDDARQATLDMVGGMRDLAARVVRAIGEPHLRFTEDKLRMLRAVRFAARFDFELDLSTAAAIRELATGIGQVSAERVRDELTKMLTEGRAKRAFELLDETGLLVQVLPEVAKMHGVEQPPQFHPEGDVWKHTLMLLDQLPEGATPTLAWGALLHDVGKPPTFRVGPDRIRFDGHVEVGVRMAEEILRRLRFGNEEAGQIVSLIANHMRFSDVEKMKESTLKRFFRLPRFAEHLALHRIDCLSSFGSLAYYNFAKERFESLPQEQVRPKLLVTGKDLIEAGYRPGPEFKRLLALAEDAQLEGRIHTRDEGLALIGRAVQADGASER